MSVGRRAHWESDFAQSSRCAVHFHFHFSLLPLSLSHSPSLSLFLFQFLSVIYSHLSCDCFCWQFSFSLSNFSSDSFQPQPSLSCDLEREREKQREKERVGEGGKERGIDCGSSWPHNFHCAAFVHFAFTTCCKFSRAAAFRSVQFPPHCRERTRGEAVGGGRAMSSVNIDLKSIHLPLRQLLIWTQLEFFISWTRRKVARVAHLLTLSEIFEAPAIVSNVCCECVRAVRASYYIYAYTLSLFLWLIKFSATRPVDSQSEA